MLAGLRRTFLQVVSLSVLVFFAPISTAAANPGTVVRWERIGHISDHPIAWLAMPPDGPTTGPLFASAVDGNPSFVLDDQSKGGGATRRSRDGGNTWEAAAPAPGRIVLPPGGTPAFSLTRDALFRSADAGGSWTSVVSVPADELLFSPSFRQDGVVFLHSADQLWRSVDQGQTWTNLDPGAGQIVSAVRLSPMFASDHTVFAGVISARPGRSREQSATDNEDSLGLLVSQDGGITWTSISDGLQIDGDPYRQVLDVALSPNFASDQTLYVSSLGPRTSAPPEINPGLCQPCSLPWTAVFRSHDAGATWDVVDQRWLPRYTDRASLRVSPAFGTDQTLTYSLNVSGAAPSQTGCLDWVSSDGGDSWNELDMNTSGAGLCSVRIASIAGTTVLLGYEPPYYLSNLPNHNIRRSLDGGATWTTLAPPGDSLVGGYFGELTQRQVVLRDAVFQATSNGDLWEYAAFPPCAIQPILSFGQVWTNHVGWQESAGCPVAPERSVQLQTLQKDVPGWGPTAYYWTPGLDVCVQVHRDYLDHVQGGTPSSASNACGGTGDSQVVGSILSFANGKYWLYVQDSPGHALVVSSDGSVLEVTP